MRPRSQNQANRDPVGEGRLRVPGKKNNSNNGVRPARGGGKVGRWKATVPPSAKKFASGSREQTAGAWRTRPERREAMKGGEGEEPSQQARSEQALAERGGAAAR